MVDVHKMRRAARMSQVELARRTRISRPRLSAAENGYLELTQNELRAIQSVITEEPARRASKIREATDGGVL